MTENKKFRVIEEGVMNLGEMIQLLGVDRCNVVTACRPLLYDCRPNDVKCGCYSQLYSIADCVNIYQTCGVVNDCGGGRGSEPYSVVIMS